MGLVHHAAGITSTPFKQCGCGAVFPTAALFRELTFVGYQLDEGDDGFVLELRNCDCGSTIAVELRGPDCERARTVKPIYEFLLAVINKQL